jgi:hypothetical protein
MTDASAILDQKIDRAILDAAGTQFLKVARIIADVSEEFGRMDEKFLERIPARIGRLVSERQLEAIGDIARWRHSEIRLPA